MNVIGVNGISRVKANQENNKTTYNQSFGELVFLNKAAKDAFKRELGLCRMDFVDEVRQLIHASAQNSKQVVYHGGTEFSVNGQTQSAPSNLVGAIAQRLASIAESFDDSTTKTTKTIDQIIDACQVLGENQIKL
jgi:hypothetical protein